MSLLRKILVGAITGFWVCSGWASGGGDTFKEGVNYIPIKPHLVVSYGGTGKIKYIKAELSLRTEDMHSAQEVAHHMPLIRDTLIMLMSGVTDEQMARPDGKEEMRLAALEQINEALEAVNNPTAHLEVKPKPKSVIKAADNHAPDEHATNDHASAEKPAAHAPEKPKKAESKSSGHGAAGPVSDVLFDNLVVQK